MLLVGKKENGSLFKIARWGEVLVAFDELVEIACDRWKAKREAALEKSRRDLERALDTLETDAKSYFRGGSVDSIYATVYP